MYSEPASAGPTPPDRPLWPSDITLHTHSRTLELVWGADRATITHHVLRMACRCAECESRRRKGMPMPAVADDIELVKIEAMGEAGLRFFFSDGHARGIFPWAYLHQLAFDIH